MSKHFERQMVADKAVVHSDVPVRHHTDRSFELPRGLYAITVGCYLGFLAIMAIGFGNPGLIIPMAIFAIFIAGGFGLPTIWATMRPDNPVKEMNWSRFKGAGIATHTGRLSANEAIAQVLILPVLIVLWGLAVVTIAALV